MGAHRVLVTGGSGFIGSHLVRVLTASGASVRVLELPGVAVSHLPRGVEVLRGSICRMSDVRRAVRGCPIVLHLAADPNLWAPRPDHFHRVNYLGTCNVLEAARDAGAARIVHVSTESILARKRRDEVMDEQTEVRVSEAVGAYCHSKARAEQAARQAAADGAPVVIASPTVPVGPGDHHHGPLTRLIDRFARGSLQHFYLDGQINLIDVRDAAAGIWAAAQRGRVGQRYLLAGENWSIRQLLEVLAQLTGHSPPRYRVPYLLALGFAWCEQQWCQYVSHQQPAATVTGVRLTRRCFRFDGSASRRELNLQLRPLRSALQETLAWLGHDTLPATPLPQPLRVLR